MQGGWGCPEPPCGSPPAQQQLEFLELRRRQLAQAALRAKRRNDLEGAKLLLRRAKGIEGLIGAARGGLPVDIAQVRGPSVCLLKDPIPDPVPSGISLLESHGIPNPCNRSQRCPWMGQSSSWGQAGGSRCPPRPPRSSCSWRGP